MFKIRLHHGKGSHTHLLLWWRNSVPMGPSGHLLNSIGDQFLSVLLGLVRIRDRNRLRAFITVWGSLLVVVDMDVDGWSSTTFMRWILFFFSVPLLLTSSLSGLLESWLSSEINLVHVGAGSWLLSFCYRISGRDFWLWESFPEFMKGFHTRLGMQLVCCTSVAVLAVGEGKVLLWAWWGQDLLDSVPHLAIGWFASSELLKWVVLIYELIDRHETSANSDDEIVFDALHDHLFLEETVSTFLLSYEETFHSFGVHTLVDELRQLFVDMVILNWHVPEVNSVQLVPVLE